MVTTPLDGSMLKALASSLRPVTSDQVTVPPSLRPGANYHKVGDDVRAGDRILIAGTQLGAAEIGIAAATGLAQLTTGLKF